MIDIENYKSETDEVNYGLKNLEENCRRCKSHIILPKKSRCWRTSCELMNSTSQEVNSSDFIRCPKCGHHESAWYNDNYKILIDGEHSYFCEKCGFKYIVKTLVSYTFESPALKEAANE